MSTPPSKDPQTTEHTPLLGDPLLDEANAPALDPTKPSSYSSELRLLFNTAIPIFLSFALQNVVQASSILIVGSLGTYELGVASYGYMFAASTGSMLGVGGATALDTLCSQAITSVASSEKPYVLRAYLQRGILFLTALFFCTTVPLWWFSGRLFIALGQEEAFAMDTGLFLRYLMVGGMLQVVAECLKKFLQVQGYSFQVGCCIGVAAVFGIGANVLFVRVLELGFIGAPLAHTVYHLCTVTFLLIYTSMIPDSISCWYGFRVGKWTDWSRFANMAIVGIVSQAAESFSFEILAMMAARLDQASIGAQGIIITSDMILYTIPIGISVAANHRIGNLVGAGNVSGLKLALRIPYLLSLIFGLVEFILIMLVKDSYGHLFSNDPAVIQLTSKVLPVIAIFQVLDLSNNGAGGVLRGAGKVHLVGFSNIIGYYGIGMVFSWYLCFRLDLGLVGLWGGLVTGSAVLLVAQTVFVGMIDWEKEVEFVRGQDHGQVREEEGR